jgi:LPXTG-site transpeptidase (sortase) family protein
MIAGVLLLGLLAAYYVYAKVTGARLPSSVKAESEVKVASLPSPTVVRLAEPSPEASPTPTPSPATRIVIASIGVDSKVVEIGTKYNDKGELVWETAAYAVGHHLGTANPGEAGKIVMSGHISSPISREGDVFRRLADVKLGDEIILYNSSGGEFHYKVTETQVVLPTEVSVMNPSSEEILVLITCWPDWVYTYRFVVIAKPY